ncbi:hypothetical protein AVEN_144085-1 [Araneus ventricosus]|uniref:Uncharacterized protein n=1 Tax=Araneus ventricosus TaxID=182803 RepID=A0A4Y2SU86_ARAVE|nr:hypothetical protein AVEN_144085-1 [Araneus ventricosus]
MQLLFYAFYNCKFCHQTSAFKGVNSEAELEDYCVYHQKDDDFLIVIGTIFKDFERKLPASLDYKIRYGSTSSGDTFPTNMKYRVNGPHDDNPYLDSFFLAWQASVEQTFINRKMIEHGKGSELGKYQVWMQKFPYPEHKNTKDSFSIVNIVPWVICYGYLIFIMNIMRRVIEEKSNGSKVNVSLFLNRKLYFVSSGTAENDGHDGFHLLGQHLHELLRLCLHHHVHSDDPLQSPHEGFDGIFETHGLFPSVYRATAIHSQSHTILYGFEYILQSW